MIKLLLASIATFLGLLFYENQLLAKNQNSKIIKYILPNSYIYKSYIDLPQVLSSQDMELYYRIFNFQHKKDFKSANKLIAKLDDKSLLGYVYYERYESRYYKSQVQELKAWMNNYYNLPVAKDIYALLKRKAGRNVKLKVPKPLVVGSISPIYTQKDFVNDQDMSDIANWRVITPIAPKRTAISKKLDRYLKKGQTKLVKNTLMMKSTKKELGNKTYAYYAAALAKMYFLDGRDSLSIEWGKKALLNYAKYFPDTNVVLGLVNWRQKNYQEATKYFAFVVNNKGLYSSNVVSKAAYWNARSNLKLGDFKSYYSNLNVASNYYYDFYGILASEELGITPDYSSSLLELSPDNVNLLLNDEHGKRALALLQFGLVDWAEQELILFARYGLNKYNNNSQLELTKALVYLAQKVPMPMLSVSLAGMKGIYYGLGYLAYPIFHVGYDSDYIVDPLLITAIMRRESFFYSGAVSNAGAIGLMQLMPNTAKMLINNASYNNLVISNASIKTILRNPKYNFDLGQRYVKMLLNSSISRGNLVYSLAGWNGGLLNVKKWSQDSFRMPQDPLFFIESIPFSESRGFVKKVLTDYWVYQITVKATPLTALELINNQEPIYKDPPLSYLQDIGSFSYDLNINTGTSNGAMEVNNKKEPELLEEHEVILSSTANNTDK